MRRVWVDDCEGDSAEVGVGYNSDGNGDIWRCCWCCRADRRVNRELASDGMACGDVTVSSGQSTATFDMMSNKW